MPEVKLATPEMAVEYARWFVNRLAYTRQSERPHPQSGRHYYYRPRAKSGGELGLELEDIRRHLAGEITLGIYAINPKTQRVKWMGIDADYKRSLDDLLKLQYELQQDGIQAALEQSRRGGHLWILFETPVLAKHARVYIRHLAGKLSVQVKAAGPSDGIELFPKQDRIDRTQFGNAIRGPLGVHRAVKPGGVLALVIPFDRIYECRNILSPHFKDKAIYRLTEPQAERYKQAVVFGVRRSAAEKNRLNDQTVNQANWKLQELTRRYEDIPALPDEADRAYAVPQSGPIRMENRGLPLDLVEDLLEKSPAWLQAQRVTHAQREQFFGRPLTPLHAGHVGLCAVSGLLNGVFGSGAERHVAHWEAIKVVDKTEEEGDDGETVIREKERFSQRLTLLFTDGRIELLSEKPREDGSKETPHGERPPANGEIEVCAADA
jgi:hypothetical protein